MIIGLDYFVRAIDAAAPKKRDKLVKEAMLASLEKLSLHP